MINFYCIDNIEFMKTKPDKYYDLAIVDPPYGIGAGTKKFHNGKNGKGDKRWKNRNYQEYTVKNWDYSIPDITYFTELFRVSKNQIIWGGNYFSEYLHSTSCWLFWDKDNGMNSFSDGELAWTSFGGALRKFKYLWNGFQKKIPEKRIHPTQKPVDLYRWILQNFAKKGWKILDTHGGSFNHAIAAEIEGFDLDIMDIDSEYFAAGVNAFNLHKRQQRLF